MTETKPIPVRLTRDLIIRLDIAAERTGLGNRTAVIKLCLVLFLDGLEKQNYRLPGVDISDLIQSLDGRTHRYEMKPSSFGKVAESTEEYGPAKKKHKK